MIFNPHKLGMHKVLKHIPLAGVFDAPYKAAVKKAVNIADLRLIAKSRAHKVRFRKQMVCAYLFVFAMRQGKAHRGVNLFIYPLLSRPFFDDDDTPPLRQMMFGPPTHLS